MREGGNEGWKNGRKERNEGERKGKDKETREQGKEGWGRGRREGREEGRCYSQVEK